MTRAGTPDRLEGFVHEYLTYLNRGRVIYEPMGLGKAPDFSINSEVAVEVTRLVKEIPDDLGRSLETVLPPTYASIKRAIERVQTTSFSQSYWVDLNVNFPITPHQTTRVLKKKLREFADDPLNEKVSIQVDERLGIRISPTGKTYDNLFVLGSSNSPHFSGWVVSELLDHCEAAIVKKERLLSSVFCEYKQTWLAVESHLTTGLSEYSYLDFLGQFNCKTKFDSLILINGQAPNRSRQIKLH